MTLPGNIGGAIGPGDDWQARAIRDLQRQVANLSTARTLQNIATSAVYPAVANNEATGVSFDAGPSNWAPVSIAVPAGYTRAMVTAVASMSVRAGSSGGSAFSACAVIGSTVSGAISSAASIGGNASATAALSWSGSVSGTVTAALQATVQAPSMLLNGLAQVSLTVLFLR